MKAGFYFDYYRIKGVEWKSKNDYIVLVKSPSGFTEKKTFVEMKKTEEYKKGTFQVCEEDCSKKFLKLSNSFLAEDHWLPNQGTMEEKKQENS